MRSGLHVHACVEVDVCVFVQKVNEGNSVPNSILTGFLVLSSQRTVKTGTNVQ